MELATSRIEALQARPQALASAGSGILANYADVVALILHDYAQSSAAYHIVKRDIFQMSANTAKGFCRAQLQALS